jgi:glyoxylase-like metal-dependent hydrolase (beta-lactamase superfamily II)
MVTQIAGCLELIDDDTEIAPGIHALLTPGHTPGHLAVSVVSEGEQLLCISDTVGHPVHLEHPEWNILYDYEPEMAVHSRRQVIDRAVSEHAPILAYHFDFPGLGYIYRQQGGLKWQPIEAMDSQ